jgi:hypothetical protein
LPSEFKGRVKEEKKQVEEEEERRQTSIASFLITYKLYVTFLSRLSITK